MTINLGGVNFTLSMIVVDCTDACNGDACVMRINYLCTCTMQHHIHQPNSCNIYDIRNKILSESQCFSQRVIFFWRFDWLFWLPAKSSSLCWSCIVWFCSSRSICAFKFFFYVPSVGIISHLISSLTSFHLFKKYLSPFFL